MAGDEKPKAPTLGEVMRHLHSVATNSDQGMVTVRSWLRRWDDSGRPEHDYPEGWPADGELATLDNCSPADSVLFGYGSEWLTLQATHLWGAGIVRGSGVIVVRRRRPEPRPYTVKASEVDPAKHLPAEGGRWIGTFYTPSGEFERIRRVDRQGSVLDAYKANTVRVVDREPQS